MFWRYLNRYYLMLLSRHYYKLSIFCIGKINSFLYTLRYFKKSEMFYLVKRCLIVHRYKDSIGKKGWKVHLGCCHFWGWKWRRDATGDWNWHWNKKWREIWLIWFKRNLLSNFIGPKGPLKKGHIAYNWINDNAYYINMI